MKYGMPFKAKSQITNYLNKQKNKQKNYSNSTSNNTIISEKDTNRIIVETFRKGSVKENCAGFTKFKTGKNSPEHFLFKQEKSKEMRSLSGKQKELNNEQNMEIKSILSTSKIKKMLKESIGFDSMFKRKIQMIHNKNQKNENSQLTYSNIYNHNSTKIKVENSLYHKVSKNESFVKKKTVNHFDEDDFFNFNNNKACSPRLKNSLEQDISGDNKQHFRVKSNSNHENMKEGNHCANLIKKNEMTNSNSNNNTAANINTLNYGNGCNHSVSNSKSKTKQTDPNPMLMNPNNSHNVKKINHQTTKSKSGLIENNFINSNKKSNPNLIGDYKKMCNSAFPSKNNSRKNSIEKINQVYCKNGNNPSSSTLKIYNYQNSIKGKNNLYAKRSSSSSIKHIFNQELKQKSLSNQNIKSNSQNKNSTNQSKEHNPTNQNDGKNSLINMINIVPSPRISSTRLPSSLQEINNKENNNTNINYCALNIQSSNNAVVPTTTKSHTNMSDIKYNEYVTSNHKNSSSKGNIINNPSSKKCDEKEKDVFLAKLKASQKHNKSLTTVQSKQNSKSNSRVEDYFNVPLSNKANEELFNLCLGNKSDKMLKKHSIISNKKPMPITTCQSPLSKTAQEILKKINVNKSPQLEGDKRSKKALVKNGFENIKKSLESLENLLNNPKHDDIKSNGADIEQLLNETCESIQSTARESAFYRREFEKITNYIKQYYKINGVYPPSKIQFYRCGRLIGRGAFGKVNLALHVCSGRLVAMKSFNKSKNTLKHSKNKIKNEIEMLKQLQHPFVSKILDTFETEKHIVIVMEYICGDLFSFIKKRSKLSEASSKVIFKQIIEGLKFIHQNHIVHRDIKLDNILIDLDNTVKICDFGVSKKINPGATMHDHCGTPAYIAPEIFQKKGYQGFACDIWSSGVTLYYMLSGSQPFKANNLPELHSLIISGKYDKLDGISSEAKDLIDGMLQVDPKKRLTISQILTHPWLSSVDIKNRSQLNLFTTAEKVILAKHNIDYLNSNKEDIIEHFTLKNLDTLKEEEFMNGNTKSHILAPFNSVVNTDDSLFSSEIKIENEIWKFGGKVKQLNIKYELNNNKHFDNGVIITQQESDEKKENQNAGLTSSSGKHSSSKPISPHGELEEAEDYLSNPGQRDYNIKHNGLENSSDESSFNEEEVINDALVMEIEMNVGYKKKYLIDCLEKKNVNYATAGYHLLDKKDQSKNGNRNN